MSLTEKAGAFAALFCITFAIVCLGIAVAQHAGVI